MIAHVISLEHRTDRQAHILGQGSTRGFEVQFWPGIKHDFVQTGIARAHKQIVKYAKDNNLDEVLIMEDDCWFPASDGFEYFIESKPSCDWDIYLGGVYTGEIYEDNTVDRFSGLHCYIVRQKFYDTFLSLDEKRHIDSSLNGKGRYVVCNPFAAIQLHGYSDNARMEVNYRSILKKHKIRGYTP